MPDYFVASRFLAGYQIRGFGAYIKVFLNDQDNKIAF